MPIEPKYRILYRRQDASSVQVYTTFGMSKVSEISDDADILVQAAEALEGSSMGAPYIEACGHGLVRLAVDVMNVPNGNIPKGAR